MMCRSKVVDEVTNLNSIEDLKNSWKAKRGIRILMFPNSSIQTKC